MHTSEEDENDKFILKLNEIITILVDEYTKFKSLNSKLKTTLFSDQFTWVEHNDKTYVFYKMNTKIEEEIKYLDLIHKHITNKITNKLYYDIIEQFIYNPNIFNWIIYKNTISDNSLIFSCIDDIYNYVDQSICNDLITLPKYLCFILERKILDLIFLPLTVYLSINNEKFEKYMRQILLN